MDLIKTKTEWYPIIIGTILIFTILFMPKRITWTKIYLTFGVVSALAWFSDIFVGITMDVFDLAKANTIEIGDAVTVGIIPAALAVIYANFLKYDKRIFYTILFSVISFIYEWGAVQVGYMKLKGWHTWWSIPVYLIVFGLYLPWHLRLISKNFNEKDNQDRKFNLNFLRRKEKAR